MRRPPLLLPRSYLLATFALGLMACSAEPTRVIQPPRSASLGKAAPTSAPTVTSTDPTYGDLGTRVQVHVKGSGFNSTAQASWERNGATDPRVTVLSTTYVSSGEVVADLQIASDADIDLYDVAVSVALTDGSRKKGVGIELFTVTVAQGIPSLSGQGYATMAWSINDAGQVVGGDGSNAYFWDPATGLANLGPGQALDLTEDGTIAVGNYYDGTVNHGKVWTRGPGGWALTSLSTACVIGAVGSTAPAISPDGALIGGRVVVPVSRRTNKAMPAVWDGPTSTCRLLAFPLGKDSGYVLEVSGVGSTAGAASGGGVTDAVVWDAAGQAAVLPSLGGTYSEVRGFNRSGTMATGISNGVAVFWMQTPTGWSAPVLLPAGTCTNTASWGDAVNDYGMVLGKGCDGGRWWKVVDGAVVSAGLMPGFSPTDPHPAAEEITNNAMPGQPWAAGGSGNATIWRIP